MVSVSEYNRLVSEYNGLVSKYTLYRVMSYSHVLCIIRMYSYIYIYILYSSHFAGRASQEKLGFYCTMTLPTRSTDRPLPPAAATAQEGGVGETIWWALTM